MSIKSARDEIRRRRRVLRISDAPLRWWVLSTSGNYHHDLIFDGTKVVCLTCSGKYGRDTCWASRRVEDEQRLRREVRTARERRTA